MNIIRVSDGTILVPSTNIECFVLWLLSFFVGSYEKCYANFNVYTMKRRLKI